jgi:hypothetical protein
MHGDDDRAQKHYKILKVLIQASIYVVWYKIRGKII